MFALKNLTRMAQLGSCFNKSKYEQKIVRRWSVITSAIFFILLVSVSSVFAADYKGNGQFPSGGWIRWKYTGTSPGYESRANTSIGRWHTYTDADLLKVTTNEDIKVVVTNFSITTWYGYAYVCDIYGNCTTTQPFQTPIRAAS